MLTEEHATKVQEIINEAFGNSEINKEQYKENFDKAKGVDLPHIKLLAATFKNKSQRIGSEKEKKIENVPTRPAKEISDDKVLDKSNWVILVEDRSEDNKEDILEVKEFRKMNKWNEESELTIIEYSKIEGMLNV
ncbi:16020_t:CDS:2, partial [Gigaspora rosea]